MGATYIVIGWDGTRTLWVCNHTALFGLIIPYPIFV